jgi:hypothetical protein
VLAHSARLVRDTEQFAEYGLVGIRPEVDFARVLARAQERVYRLHEKMQLLSHFQQAGIRVLENAGNIQFTSEHTVQLGDGARFHADRFIICAGGHSKQLNIPGGEHAITHGQVWMLKELPPSLVIIGGEASEDTVWFGALESLAANWSIIGQVQFQKSLFDPKIQWSQWTNIWKNAAIRTTLYIIAAPLRWVAKPFSRRKSTR